MSRRVVFVGGVHGTGKSAVCADLKKRYLCEYLSASQLIKWNKRTKPVEDVTKNQMLISLLLKENTNKDYSFIIDGHFALWNDFYECVPVPVETFQGVDLSAIVLITCNPSVIKQRIQSRDSTEYNIQDIEQLQKVEIKQAKIISEYYHIPIYIVDNSDSYNIQSVFSNLDNIMKPYTRDNIYSDMLKTVIIRLDFVGATNIRSFVDRIKQTELMSSAFNSLVAMTRQQLSVSFKPKDIEEGGLPLSASQHSTVFRFKDCKLQEIGIATLDIDCESLTIVVDCKSDYKGSKKYTSLMSSLMEQLFIHDKYITPVRLGIRKIDMQTLNEGESINDYFNDKYIVSINWKSEPTKKLVSLTELSSIDEIQFNEIQRIDWTGKGENRLILDIDSYIENGYLASIVANKKVKETMEIMQNYMFDMFVNVTSSDYLEKCKAAKSLQNG